MGEESLTKPISGKKEDPPKPKEVKNSAGEMISLLNNLLIATETQNQLMTDLLEAQRESANQLATLNSTMNNLVDEMQKVKAATSVVHHPIANPAPVNAISDKPMEVPKMGGDSPTAPNFPTTQSQPTNGKVQPAPTNTGTAGALSPEQAGKILKAQLAKRGKPEPAMSVTPPTSAGMSAIAQAAAMAKPVGTIDVAGPDWLNEPEPYRGNINS